jgi:hypothetical protein
MWAFSLFFCWEINALHMKASDSYNIQVLILK